MRVFDFGDRKVEVPVEDLEYIFKGMRPRNMDYEDFKIIRKIIGKELKKYLKGRMFHLSKMSNVVWDDYIRDMQYKPIQKGRTYVRKK